MIENQCTNPQHQKLWNDEDLEDFIKLYPFATKEEILERFPNRTWKTLCTKASRMNIKRRKNYWTAEEDSIIKEFYVSQKKEDLLKLLKNRTWCAIIARAHFLKQYKMQYTPIDSNKNLQISDVESAWLACAIDGEGTIELRKQTYPHGWCMTPRISIYNTNMDFVIHCKDILNVGSIYTTDSRDREKKDHSFTVSSAHEIYTVLKKIKNFLIIKKEIATLLLEFLDIQKELIKIGGVYKKRRYTERQHEIYKEIRNLNKKGR